MSAGDLGGKTVRVVIASVKFENMQNRSGAQEQKPVLYFKNVKKGMVLNKTNSDRIAHHYTWDTDQWIGKPLDLYTAEVDAFGEQVEAVRVKVPTDGAPAIGAVVPAARARAPQAVPASEPAAAVADEFSDLPPEDEEIPF